MSRAGRIIIGEDQATITVCFGNRPQPLYQGQGRTYISGDPETAYAIEVANTGTQRIEVQAYVDGTDVLRDDTDNTILLPAETAFRHEGAAVGEMNTPRDRSILAAVSRGIVLPPRTTWRCETMKVAGNEQKPLTLPYAEHLDDDRPLVKIIIHYENEMAQDESSGDVEELVAESDSRGVTRFARHLSGMIRLYYVTPDMLPRLGAASL